MKDVHIQAINEARGGTRFSCIAKEGQETLEALDCEQVVALGKLHLCMAFILYCFF